jgi:hypothetical protein
MSEHIISLRDSLTPLVSYFNEHGNRTRFVAILSPT